MACEGVEQPDLSRMVATLQHRGPDEVGTYLDGTVALGLTRLAIVDVLHGQQPVTSEDGSVIVVCNGEIYNFMELAADLRAKGHALRSASDVEVIPHLYEEYGSEFVHHLRGMYAIALWDTRDRSLLLARDRAGKKPLVFAESRGGLVFGSEVRAVLAAGLPRSADLDAIDHTLAFGYPPIDATGHVGIRAVPPGCVLTWHAGRWSTTPYATWDAEPSTAGESGAGQHLEEVLEEAVRIRLMSERPLGSFLSGGIDSTIVTALMARHHDGPVSTFAIGFRDPAYDESPYARAVAEVLGTDHHELIVDPDPESFLPMLQSAFDQPFADSSAIPTLLLSRFAAEHVTVALSGDGGDEMFAGYERYRAAPVLQRLNPLLRIGGLAAAPLEKASERLGRPRLARLGRALTPAPSLGDRYRSLMTLVPPGLRRDLWTAEARAALTSMPERTFGSVWDRHATADDVATMRSVDVATYLPGDLLAKVDISSMAHSLEVRSPFLDREVMAFAARLPTSLLLRHGQTKWILRELACRLVPSELIDRPKQGFGIPRAAWLRTSLREPVHDLLLDNTARQRAWFEPRVVRGVLDRHDAGIDQDAIIWPLMMTELWARAWVDVDS